MSSNLGTLSTFVECITVGKGFRAIITSRTPGSHIGYAAIDQGRYEDSKWWVADRRLNADEIGQGGAWRFDPSSIHIEQATTYRYR